MDTLAIVALFAVFAIGVLVGAVLCTPPFDETCDDPCDRECETSGQCAYHRRRGRRCDDPIRPTIATPPNRVNLPLNPLGIYDPTGVA